MNDTNIKMNTQLTDEMINGFTNYFSTFFNQPFKFIKTGSGRYSQYRSNDYIFTVKASFIQCGTTDQMEETLQERLDSIFSEVTFEPNMSYILYGEHGKYNIQID